MPLTLGNHDLHLALHSNAAPRRWYGQIRGILVFYYPALSRGQRAATLVADGLKTLYPLPNRVRASPLPPSERYAESTLPPSFLSWATTTTRTMLRGLKNNLEAVARNIVLSLTEYFGVPLPGASPLASCHSGCLLGLSQYRDKPDTSSPRPGQGL